MAPQINVEVWLPTETYNGRVQAVGNGGYAGRISYHADGYATASTDTGRGQSSADGSFGLGRDGTLNWLIVDFASRSLFQMTEKAHTHLETLYGAGAKYSY